MKWCIIINNLLKQNYILSPIPLICVSYYIQCTKELCSFSHNLVNNIWTLTSFFTLNKVVKCVLWCYAFPAYLSRTVKQEAWGGGVVSTLHPLPHERYENILNTNVFAVFNLKKQFSKMFTINKYTRKRTDKRTDEHKDRQTDKQTDRQTDREAHPFFFIIWIRKYA